MDTELLKPLQAARVLNISARKLWELTNRRELACIRVGRAVRYRLDDLKTFVERNRRSAL